MTMQTERITAPGKHLIFFIAVIMLALFATPSAFAETNEDLYLEALRAIHEQRTLDAKEILTKLVSLDPQHAGALLDLAIIQCELGNFDEAQTLFDFIVKKFTPAPSILEIIEKRRAQGCTRGKANSRTSFLIERGYETNVNQGASNPIFGFGEGATRVDLQLQAEYLPRKDRFNTVALDYVRELFGNTIGFAQIRNRNYDNLTEFNTFALSIGLEHPWRVDKWRFSSTFFLSALALDSRLYQKQQLYQTRVTLPLSLPDSLQVSLIGGISKVQYPTLSGYGASIFELRSSLSYQNDSYRVQTGISYLIDHAEGARIGGSRSGVLFNLLGRKQFNDQIFGELGWSYQTWKSENIYSPGLIDKVRAQKTHTIRAALNLSINENQSFQVEIRKVSNRENISLFEFTNNVIQGSWQWQHY